MLPVSLPALPAPARRPLALLASVLLALACALSPLAPAARAQTLANADFESWPGGALAGWSLSGGATAARVEAWSGAAARLGLGPSPSSTAALSQTLSPAFTDLFEIAFDFAQAPSGAERGASLSLRTAGSEAVLSWRVSPEGALELYDGAAWRAVTPASTVLSTDLSDPASDRVYRLTLTGSLSLARYRLRLHARATGASLADLGDLAHWQLSPAGRSLSLVRIERGRSGGDYLVDNAAARVPAASELEVPPPPPVAVAHPSLLFSAADIPALRARAALEPWKSVAAAAVQRADTLAYTTSGTYRSRALRLKEIVSALALAALVDDSVAPSVRASRFHSQLNTGLAHLANNRPGGWDGHTPVGSLLFDAILALDVLHPHLSPAQRSDIESLLAAWVPTISGWDPSPQSVRALWALYLGDESDYVANRDAYLFHLFKLITPDGVYASGSNYALARLNYYDREQKHLLTDVIRRRDGLSPDHERRLRLAYEWLYGYAMAPHGWNHVFGDTAPNRRLSGAPEYPDASPTAAYRAGLLSTDAQAYARRHHQAPAPAGGLLPFLLLSPDLARTPARLAPSRVFPDGGAWLQTETAPHGALSAALWNTTLEDSHAHKETNALSLSAYGELLLSNVGYAGYNTTALGYSWTYINGRAVSGNTVLIDYPLADAKTAPSTRDHQRKRGAGLASSLLSGEIDYACGHSGSALPNGVHQRHLAFVHPLDSLPGYWLVLDEVSASAGSVYAHAAWHPYAPALQTLAPDEHYRALCQRFSPAAVALDLHLTTPPDGPVPELDGVIAHFNDLSFVGRFLYPRYALAAGPYRRFGALFFPASPAGPAPALSRETGPGWHATRLAWPDGTVDRWVVTQTDSPVTAGPAHFRARAAWLRAAPDGSLRRLLLVEGDHLAPASAPSSAWFSASAPGTLQAGPDRVSLAGPGAPAWTLRRPDILRAHASDGATHARSADGLALPAGARGVFQLDRPRPPRAQIEIGAGATRLRADELDPALRYRWESSTDLQTWTPLGPVLEGRSATDHVFPTPPGDRHFHRLRLVTP